MGLPRGIPKKTKTSLKGDLAHPVPPPSLPGQGRERRQRKRAERRRVARGVRMEARRWQSKCVAMGSGQKVATVFDDPLAGVPPGRQAVRRDEF